MRTLGFLRYSVFVEHISDGDLLLHQLGMVRNEDELRPIEEHLLWCQACLDRAEALTGHPHDETQKPPNIFASSGLLETSGSFLKHFRHDSSETPD
jgi:hypothetical protein